MMGSAIGRSAPRHAVHIEWISNAQELERLEQAWRALEDAVPRRTHVSTFDFIYPWTAITRATMGGAARRRGLERGCFYDITLSYDESFAALGPGMFLMQETLRQCAEAGIHTVVSHGAHEYKRTWATRFVPQKRLFLFRRRPRATAARLMRFGLQPLWRRLAAFPALGDATASTR